MTYSQAWLEDPLAIRGVLVEATVYDVVNKLDKVVYLSNIGYITEDSLTSYLPIIKGGVSFSEQLNVDGGASMSFGDLSISNYNGEYDDWLDVDKYVWSNRPITVYIGDPMWVCNDLTAVRNTFEVVFTGLIADIDTKSKDTLDFKVRDKLEQLNSSITENTLGTYGTWSGGQTNTETIKPIIFGEVFNVEPLLIDNANLEYMVCDSYVHVWVSEIQSAGNYLICDSTLNLELNAPIVFSDNALTPVTVGGIVPNTTYFIKSIVANKITVSSTISGATLNLTNTLDTKLVGRSPVTTRGIESIIEVRDNGVPIYNSTTLPGYVTTTTSSNSSLSMTTTVTKTSSAGNAITVASTVAFTAGAPISFSGTTFGNIVAGTTYYIKEVYTPFEFTISSTSNLATTFVVTNSTGSCSASISLPNVLVCSSTTGLLPTKKIVFSQNIGGLLANKVYYVKQVYTSTIFSVSATLGGATSTLSTYTGLNVSTLVPSVLPYLNTGTFTLNNSPAGTLTVSVQGLKNSINFPSLVATPTLSIGTYRNNMASIVALIVTQYGKSETKLSLLDIDQTNFFTFSNTYPQVIGINVSDKTNVLDVCTQILGSVGSQLYMTRKGKLQILTIGTPTSDEEVPITTSDILHHSLSISQKIEAQPAFNLAYCKDWTVQTGLLTSIPQSHKDLFATEWYTRIYTDNSLKTLYKTTAIPEQKDTLLIAGDEANEEALRLTNLYSKPKFVYKFTGTSKLLSLKLGQSVLLTHPRFGLSDGKTGQVIALNPNWLDSTIDIEVLI